MTSTNKDTHVRAALIHVSAAIGNVIDLFLPLFWSITIPTVIWLFGGSDPFFSQNGREAVRFQVVTLIYSIGLFLLCGLGMIATGAITFTHLGQAIGSGAEELVSLVSISVWGILFFVGKITLFLASLFMPLYAAKKARNGEEWAYPFVFSPRKK